MMCQSRFIDHNKCTTVFNGVDSREAVDIWGGSRKYMGIVHFPLSFAMRLKSL